MDIDQLGKYEIRGTLGKGAMGTVYEGWDPIIARQVAIKTVRLPDADDDDAQEELARFKREAQAAGRLTHPNIVGVFDYGETDELAYIVMEFVDGRTLKALLDAGERLPLAEVVRVMDGRAGRPAATATSAAWCIATSSRPTSCSTQAAARPRSPISASPGSRAAT